MIHFDPDVGLYADDIETVRDQVKQVFINAFASKGTINTDPETPQGQIIDSLTALVVAKDSEVMYLANQFNPETASGVWQEALARIYYLDKNLASSTLVTCTCSGLVGTLIPAGSVVQDTNGYQYTNANAASIGDDGTVSVDFTCTETGPIACAAEQITKIVTVTPGWDSVVNTESGIVGSDEEGQGSFEQRRYNSVAGNAHGSAYAVQCAMKKLSDVKDAKVLDNRTDETKTTSLGVKTSRHSVSICVLGGEEEDVGKVIYERLDAGVGTGGTLSDDTVKTAYTPVTPSSGDNPKEKGWYVQANAAYPSIYTVTTDTTVVKNKVYYTKSEAEVKTITYTAEDNIKHEYVILRPVKKPIYLYVKIRYTSRTKASVEEDIRTAIYNDFIGNSDNATIGLGETVYASRFSVPIIKDADFDGLISIDISKVYVSGGSGYTDSIELSAIEYPILENNSTYIQIELVE